MAGGAATPEARPETDEQSSAGGDGPACRHLRRRQRETDELAEEWRQNEACNEGCTPTLFFGMTDEPVENAADTGDAPGSEHKSATASPIKVPPIAAESGVKLSIASATRRACERSRNEAVPQGIAPIR